MEKIRAINKAAMVSEFTKTVWDLMPAHKNGFVPFTGQVEQVVVPDKIIEFQAKKKEDVAAQESEMTFIPAEAEPNQEIKTEPVPEPEPAFEPAPEPEPVIDPKEVTDGTDIATMKQFLKDRGISFHHNAGYEKIKTLYDANRK